MSWFDLDFFAFHRLLHSVWADENLAGLAEQPSKEQIKVNPTPNSVLEEVLELKHVSCAGATIRRLRSDGL